jgi:hypothetical protein
MKCAKNQNVTSYNMLEYLLRRERQSLRKVINRLGVFVDIKKPYCSLLGIDWLF